MLTTKEQQEAMLQEVSEKDFKEYDNINHPSHYNSGKIEVIDYIEDQGLGTGFCLGNAIKYISRAGKKKGESAKSDVMKSIWYLQRYLDTLKDKED